MQNSQVWLFSLNCEHVQFLPCKWHQFSFFIAVSISVSRCGAILHFINIHYELTTGTFPPNTVWFGEETDDVMVCYYWLCKHSIHVSFESWQAKKERAKPLYTMLFGDDACAHTLFSVTFRTHIFHPIGSDVLTFTCVYFAIRSIGLSIRLYCRSQQHVCTFETHVNVKWNRCQLHCDSAQQ